MRTIGIEQATLERCVQDAQQERIVITGNGKPLVLIVGVEGIDIEQLELGSSDKFWTLMQKRRTQKSISRAELERRLNNRK